MHAGSWLPGFLLFVPLLNLPSCPVAMQLCNCLCCGKIICEMEAGHTCTFCGSVLSISGMGKKAITKVVPRVVVSLLLLLLAGMTLW